MKTDKMALPMVSGSAIDFTIVALGRYRSWVLTTGSLHNETFADLLRDNLLHT